ncbi:MAG: iron ABC transporter permease [Deltaproteobacteria bacterium]|nr:MAG: iron ABC transporter permease [Deltaproteobacteria bacterium]
MKPWLVIAALLILLLLSMVMGVVWGSVSIPWPAFWSALWGEGESTNAVIVWKLRMPRVLLGACVGYALGLCGAVMQGVFRNPLAEPYLLGIAGGSTAGAALVFALGLGHLTLLLPMGAFVGGLLAMSLVYSIAHAHVLRLSNTTLILAGVAVGSVFASFTSFLMFFSSREQLQQVIFWLMGSLASARWEPLGGLAVVVALGSVVLLSRGRELNAMALGDDMAQHLGIHPLQLKRLLLLVATLLTSASVAFSGTIGFVGLVVPHAVRLVMGPDHRWLLPISGLTGAVFLVLCDLLARTVLPPMELPVGLITALFGAPFFLYLLRSYREVGSGGAA